MSKIKNLEVNYDMLSDEKKHDLYLRKLATGEIQGPPTGKPSQDKPWLKYYSEEAIASDVPSMSIYDYLYNCISDEPDRVLIDFLGKKITAKEILDNIALFADKFNASGIKKGDVVGLALPNIPESVYCIYALSKIGAIPCNIDPRSSAESMKHDLKTSNSKDLVCIDSICNKVNQVSKDYSLQNVTVVYALQSAPATPKFGLIKLLNIFSNIKNGNYKLRRKYKSGKIVKKGAFESDDCTFSLNDDLAVIVHTGGTTGVHKGVMLSNDALNSTVYQHRYLMDNINCGDTMYNPLPQFMSYGMTTVHLALCSKLCMFMMPISSPKTFGKEIANLKPNVVYGGPIHYQTGRKSVELDNADLSSVKIMVSGGERVSKKEEETNNIFYKKLGVQDDIYNGYGASEMCGVFSVKKGSNNSEGSVGIPFPHNVVKIINPDTKEELGYNKVGEILLRGDSLMLGYDNNCETANVIEDGWFISGDLGYVNENGELYITGRKKRQFVSGVDKIYCPVIEDCISKCQYVEKCVVVGVNDDELRKVPYAYIVVKPEYKGIVDFSEIEKEISNKIISEFSISSVPKYFEYVEDILYTSQGKVDFVKMEESAEKKLTLTK